MVKKTYIIPAAKMSSAVAVQIIAASITNIGGDADLEINTGEIPDEGDVKEFDFFGDEAF